MKQPNCDKFYIYFYQGLVGVEFSLTSNPELTICYISQNQRFSNKQNIIGFIGPGLRIGEAHYLMKLLTKATAKPWLFRKLKVKSHNDFFSIAHKIKKQLKAISTKTVFRGLKLELELINILEQELDYQGSTFTSSLDRALASTSAIDQLLDKNLMVKALNYLQGRVLYKEEIIQGLEELGCGELTLNLNSDFLEWLRLNEIIDILPSVTYQSDGTFNKDVLRCSRCGQSSSLHLINCIGCGGTCYYCESCAAMGEATLCRPLYKWNLPKHQAVYSIDYESNQVNNQGKQDPLQGIQLTAAQHKAYQDLKRFMLSPEEKALLVAVCGAGKTEIVFGAIDLALSQGKRVLFAIPRKDVVLELLPRLKRAFPQANPIALYGGSPDKYKNSQLIIATTHQTLRFADVFDLVILDEVDAFPYRDSRMLKYAVERARAKFGKIIYMTATPGQELLEESTKDNWTRLTIPARHHGHPIPEPQMIVEKSSALITPKVLDFIIKTLSKSQCQLFIFVPSIELAEKVCEAIREKLSLLKLNPNLIQFSHSKDKLREKKREMFSQGLFPIFVTTSIMERGVTVPKANVLVLFAHWEKLYDQGTLIQMAGRAGRSKAYPYGEVIFHGAQITKSMRQAQKIIINLNKEAFQAGYLNGKKI